MNARFFALACVGVFALLFAASSARAEIMIEPVGGPPLLPGGSINLFFPEEEDHDGIKRLTFEGSIQNISFTAPTTMEFWFDWSDGFSVFQILPLTFTLTPIGGGHNAEIFSRSLGTELTTTIPYCPPEISIHWRNLGPGGPVVVSGTFRAECPAPEPIALVVFPLTMLMLPVALLGAKKFAGAA